MQRSCPGLHPCLAFASASVRGHRKGPAGLLWQAAGRLWRPWRSCCCSPSLARALPAPHPVSAWVRCAATTSTATPPAPISCGCASATSAATTSASPSTAATDASAPSSALWSAAMAPPWRGAPAGSARSWVRRHEHRRLGVGGSAPCRPERPGGPPARRGAAAADREHVSSGPPCLPPTETGAGVERHAPLRRRAAPERLAGGCPGGGELLHRPRRLVRRTRHRGTPPDGAGRSALPRRHRTRGRRHRRRPAAAAAVASLQRLPLEPARLRRLGRPLQAAADGVLLPRGAAPLRGADGWAGAAGRPVELRPRQPQGAAQGAAGAAAAAVPARCHHRGRDRARGSARSGTPCRRPAATARGCAALWLGRVARPGAAGAGALHRHPPRWLRALPGRDGERPAHPLACAAQPLPQPRPAPSAGGDPPARSRRAGARHAARQPGGRDPPDPGLARIHPRPLPLVRRRLHGAQPFRRHPAAAPLAGKPGNQRHGLPRHRAR